MQHSPTHPTGRCGTFRCTTPTGATRRTAEGRLLLGLQYGEGGALPPALYIQPRVDQQHIYQDPASEEPVADLDKFVAAWRGRSPLDLVYYEAPRYFTTQDPRSAASRDAFARVVDFFRKHIPDPES